MIDVHQSYCDNCFMIDVSQIIMLYIFNLNGNVCQQKKQHLKFQSTVSPYGSVEGSLCLQMKGCWFCAAAGGTVTIPGLHLCDEGELHLLISKVLSVIQVWLLLGQHDI